VAKTKQLYDFLHLAGGKARLGIASNCRTPKGTLNAPTYPRSVSFKRAPLPTPIPGHLPPQRNWFCSAGVLRAGEGELFRGAAVLSWGGDLATPPPPLVFCQVSIDERAGRLISRG